MLAAGHGQVRRIHRFDATLCTNDSRISRFESMKITVGSVVSQLGVARLGLKKVS